MMGSPPDEPGRDDDEKQHQVTLTYGFYMQTTEVTQGQWEAVMNENPSYFKDCGKDCPVENVSWNDVQEFIKKLSLNEEKKYRLPREAEWEYACRAGTKTPFSFGRCLNTDQANYDGSYPLKGCEKGEYRGKTIRTASFPTNMWGLHDMHGNVNEWCQEWYGEYQEKAVFDQTLYNDRSSWLSREGSSVRRIENGNKQARTGTESIKGSILLISTCFAGINPSRRIIPADRVIRGGSWIVDSKGCRSSNRNRLKPDDRNSYLGFRLVFLPK